MYLTSSDLEITHDDSRDQIIGTRFQGLMIPEGAKILEAYIQFTVDEVLNSKNRNPFDVDIHAEKTADSAAFTTESPLTPGPSSGLWKTHYRKV